MRLVVLSLAVIVGCPPTGSRGDAALDTPSADADLDGDGLCDVTETRSSASARDTDGDGLWDLAELQAGGDPRDAADPLPEARVTLRDEVGARAMVRATFVVDGAGHTFSCGVVAMRRPFGAGEDATPYLGSVRALEAVPRSNVATIDGARFRGVTGRTLLTCEVELRVESASGQECTEAYPFVAQVRRDGDGRVETLPRTLEVVPSAAAGDARYCLPTRCY